MIELNRSPQTNGIGKIKVIGLGGAGSNALDRLILDGLEDAEHVAMNCDVQSLTSSVANEKVQLGRGATRGLGAGGDPEIGLAAAEEAIDEIRQALEGAAMIFICAGLGGGTGSGAAPVIAHLAREQGALVIAVAMLPFSFEGKRRTRQAEEALLALQAAADIVVCFENDKMGEAVSPKAGIHQAFANADHTISQSVRAICDLAKRPGLLHIGFDDLAAALRNANARCVFGFGEADGDNRAHDALARALKNPLMDRGRMLADAQHALVNISGGPGMTLNEVQILMDELGRHIGDETRISFGTSVDPKMANRISVTIISSIAGAIVKPHARAAAEIEREPEAVAPVAEEEPQTASAIETEPVFEEELIEVEPTPEPVAEKPKRTQVRAMNSSNPDPSPMAAPVRNAQPQPAAQERQETLSFEPVSRGRFEKSEPTIVDGEDLDVPTFLRRNVRVK